MFVTMRSDNGIQILYDPSSRGRVASWRRMFVTRPPVRSMTYTVGYRPYGPPIVRDYVSKDGLTLGDIRDFFADHVRPLVFSFGSPNDGGEFDQAICTCPRWDNTIRGPCGCIKVLLSGIREVRVHKEDICHEQHIGRSWCLTGLAA